MIKFYAVLFFMMVFVCPMAYASILDSGVPLPKEYTKELVASFIGQKADVFYVNGESNDRIVVNIIGVLYDRYDKDGFVLLGITECRNRIVIPIEKIYLIEERKWKKENQRK